ncbi:serine--tRNA ligase, mitochondrial [Prorops nasuta]|uniref:serine--tRNA ligase, mitochondrial n=1 Tax=Prorops nasuta TaxID=863751 RepID=UPI0034CD254E
MRVEKSFKTILQLRRFCCKPMYENITTDHVKLNFSVPPPEFDINFLCNPKNRELIFNNIQKRKGVGDIDKVLKLSKNPDCQEELLIQLSKIPNLTDPSVLNYGETSKILREHGSKPQFEFKPKSFIALAEKLNQIKMTELSPLSGSRSYIFLGEIAELEEALIHYTINQLLKYQFKLVSVPDIIPTIVIERCGLINDGERSLVYNLDQCREVNYSLSGTAEMSLAAKLMNSQFDFNQLPVKLTAVSRCYRAEISSLKEEAGIYRVHQFTKVEMFICSNQVDSEKVFQEIQNIQEDLFTSLGLNFNVVDMPPHDLGAPAYRKIDMEGWMPGRFMYGELSSCSNCTDYQSRRLNIKYNSETGNLLHVHTLNGTACAVPRMLIAICETYQTKDGNIKIPQKLIPYMNGKTIIAKQNIPVMKIYKDWKRN